MSLGTPNGVLIMADSRFQAETELNCHQLVDATLSWKDLFYWTQRSGSDFPELVTEFSTHKTERLVLIRSR